MTFERTSVRQIVARLEASFPGMDAALVKDVELQPYSAVAVDGKVSVLGLLEHVAADSEVHSIPALGGGSGKP